MNRSTEPLPSGSGSDDDTLMNLRVLSDFLTYVNDIMNALEQAIDEAIKTEGDNAKANKAYLEFIKANFIIPIEKHPASDEPEVLYLSADNQTFLPVFTNMDYFDEWAHEIRDDINLLKLSGVDLLKGIGEQIIVSLNIGSPVYKEFNTAELARMRSMVLKLFKK